MTLNPKFQPLNQAGPRFKVNNTDKLFALGAEDIDTMLASLALGQSRLIKQKWQVERASMPLGNFM